MTIGFDEGCTHRQQLAMAQTSLAEDFGQPPPHQSNIRFDMLFGGSGRDLAMGET